eukprot:2715336-Prymnesium_polylepis.1
MYVIHRGVGCPLVACANIAILRKVTVSTRHTDLLLRSEGVHYHRNTAPTLRRYRADLRRYRADTAPQK